VAHSYTLNLEVAASSRTLLPIYQNVQYLSTEDYNISINYHEYLRFLKKVITQTHKWKCICWEPERHDWIISY
jgi:hypothetical protein